MPDTEQLNAEETLTLRPKVVDLVGTHKSLPDILEEDRKRMEKHAITDTFNLPKKERKPRTKKSVYSAYLDTGEGTFERTISASTQKKVVEKLIESKLEGEFIIVCERQRIKAGTVHKVERI